MWLFKCLSDARRIIYILISALVVMMLATACSTSQPVASAAQDEAAPTPASAAGLATDLPAHATEPPALPAATAPRQIMLEVPQEGQAVSSPMQVQGWVSVTPFESTLRARVYDAAGQVVGEGPIMMTTEMGQPGNFAGTVVFNVRTGGPGRVEVAELSAKDGSIMVSAVASVTLSPVPATGAIEIPTAEARVTLPLHILARVGRPGEQVQAALIWQDGTVLTNNLPALPGEDGAGLVIGSIDWLREGPPPATPTQPARLELRSQAGELLAEQRLTVLSSDDPGVQRVLLYFVLGESLQIVERTIPSSEAIGTAVLNELLWGPPPNNLAGFETAIPTPEQVLTYPGRQSGWGPRVTLLKLTIVDGLATADFSKEMAAYAGGSLHVKLIHDQIAQILLQFPSVKQVIIAVEGQTEGVLQP